MKRTMYLEMILIVISLPLLQTSSCYMWKEVREEGTNAHMNKQKRIPRAGHELRDMFGRVTNWIDCGEMLQGMVTECALDVVRDVAKVWSRDLVVAKRKKWSLRPGSRL